MYELADTQVEMVDFPRCPGNSPFCLGLPEYNCCGTMEKGGSMAQMKRQKPSNVDGEEGDDNDFETKKAKLSLAKGKENKKRQVLSLSKRFNVTLTESEVIKSSKGVIPANTARSTSWAMRVFHEWVTQRNKRTKEKYPADLLDKPYSTQTISECLQRFVAEARRADGTCYPPRTLFQLLSGLLRHSREVQSNPPNFLDRNDTRLSILQ